MFSFSGGAARSLIGASFHSTSVIAVPILGIFCPTRLIGAARRPCRRLLANCAAVAAWFFVGSPPFRFGCLGVSRIALDELLNRFCGNRPVENS
jgi:hypothetical protein